MEAAPARRAPRAARRETSDSMAMVMPQLRVAACNQSTIQQSRSRCHNLDAPSCAFHPTCRRQHLAGSRRCTSLSPSTRPYDHRAADTLETEAAVLHPAHSGWCSSHPAPSIVHTQNLEALCFVFAARMRRERAAHLSPPGSYNYLGPEAIAHEGGRGREGRGRGHNGRSYNEAGHGWRMRVVERETCQNEDLFSLQKTFATNLPRPGQLGARMTTEPAGRAARRRPSHSNLLHPRRRRKPPPRPGRLERSA